MTIEVRGARFHATYSHQFVGVFATREEAKAAIAKRKAELALTSRVPSQPGRRSFAIDRALVLAARSRVRERRPQCAHCLQYMPHPNEPRELWLAPWGHRRPDGQPCPGFRSTPTIAPPPPLELPPPLTESLSDSDNAQTESIVHLHNHQTEGDPMPPAKKPAPEAVTQLKCVTADDAPKQGATPKRPTKRKKPAQRAPRAPADLRERFVREYRVDRDLEAAMKRAGYRGIHVRRAGRALMAEPEIAAAIAAALGTHSQPCEYVPAAASTSGLVSQPCETKPAPAREVEVLSVCDGRITIGDISLLPHGVNVVANSNGLRLSVAV